MNNFNVFVYGSLKAGFHNHSRIFNGAPLLGVAKTVAAEFALLSLGPYPAVIRTTENPIQIHGEVYTVSPDTLDNLDWLECHPTYYCREEVEIEGHGKCWMYVMNPAFVQQLHGTPRVESGIWENPFEN